jgi:hypothetical protein
MSGSYRLHRDAALRTGRRRAPTPGPVTTITVDRDLWAVALRAAGGDARRIEIKSATSVIIWNRPRGES